MPEPAKPPEQPVDDDGLLFGCLLNGDGTAKLVGRSEDESRLRETTDRLQRYLEEIESARERVRVIRDDIANPLAEDTNKPLCSLAIISGIFLPLAFFTGLLGINIGGMKGVENQSSFWIFCGLMVSMLGVELVIFKRLKWFRCIRIM